VFPVRYELDLYILFGRNSVFKGLNSTFNTLTQAFYNFFFIRHRIDNLEEILSNCVKLMG
jgi:hypothetical protein